eukprot:scaffold15443_cov50-Cyclotella_meneghiniana.AAC.6
MLTKPALLRFKFDGFADLPTEVDREVESEVQTDCNGNKWYLMLYPGGQSDSSEQGWISLYLYPKEIKEPLDIAYSMAVKDSKGNVVKNDDGDCILQPVGDEDIDNIGNRQFMKRAEILDSSNNTLRDGALSIEVTIQVKPSLQDDLYECEHSLFSKMEHLLESGERSDATFKVGGEIFNVHSLIVHSNAPSILANQLNQNIQGILPEVFRHILRFVYTEFCPCTSEVLKYGKELIDAANRYELVELKVDVENVLLSERIMKRENVSDWILFADAQCCPLLKEYAISYFLLDPKRILKSEHSKRLRESGEVLSEIMMLMADEEGGMTVTELRKELGKRDLDVDGSKETLAARLEIAKRQRTE